MRRLLFGGFLGAAVVLGVACGDDGIPSEFVPPAEEASVVEPPPGSFGDQKEAGAETSTDGAVDCDANPGACPPVSICGDGKAGLGESCDDDNTANGDGCSSTCQIEAPYWACAFGSKCVDVRDCDALTDAGLASDGGCTPPPKVAVCGDGFIDPGEACDDGNQKGGDGCALDCLIIEPNYACPTPGMPCVTTSVCGDGFVTGTEQCDDTNKTPGDGCSATCTVESGWTCPVPGVSCNATACGDGKLAGAEECDDGNKLDNDGCSATCKLQTTTTVVAPTTTKPGSTTIVNWKCTTPGALCTKTVCGNGGAPEGTEQCDDGNNKPLDGCSADCQWEPSCPNGSCKSRCGDGLLFDFDADGDGAIDEQCDDGNLRNGDGCSSTCTKEPGYDCSAVVEPDPTFLDVPVVLRDFKFATSVNGHPDFEKYACNEVTEDLVMTSLSAGVPVYRYDGTGLDPVTGTDMNNVCGAKAGTPDRSKQLTSAADFAQWYTDTAKSSRVDGTQLRLTRTGVAGNYSYIFNSATDAPYSSLGGFFPIDGKGFGNEGLDSNNKSHNFAFTTELRFWFTYDASKSPELTFSGDDDVWVFVNGKLALDIGGLHDIKAGTLKLDPVLMAPALGLVDGHVYEIALFHAERHTEDSNFELTVRGFVKKKSVCTNHCGDGIKTKEEQCDKGAANTNSGAYGSCRLDCKLGPYCGDKTTTNPPEQCDDGANLTSWTAAFSSTACAPQCKAPSYCGDGLVQGTFGEKCDNGTAANTGAYGKCTSTCQPGPRCGDGAVQAAAGEACDNGFNLTDYVKHPTATDCAPMCKKPRSCGDGVLDFPFEQCDKGAANTSAGTYDACTTECTLGARCGDGVKNGPEQCDDGNRTNGDGCSAACLLENAPPK